MMCPHCDEPVLPTDEIAPGHWPFAHWECVLRAVAGTVAHQQRRCGCYVPGSSEGDPPGLSRRQAARVAAMHYVLSQRQN